MTATWIIKVDSECIVLIFQEPMRSVMPYALMLFGGSHMASLILKTCNFITKMRIA